MKPNRWKTLAALAALLMAGLAGCRVRVDKNDAGKEKKVQVDTPFGGVHVNTDQTTAADLGLPAYPGATAVKDDDDNGSADVHMGFGKWQLRVRVVSFETPDAQQKVSDFYKQALGHYGAVLTCRNDQPVGQPTMTAQGLTCSNDSKGIHVNGKDGKNSFDFGKGVELKAGSKRHQHIVGFDDPKNGRTRFALIALDLPGDSDKKD